MALEKRYQVFVSSTYEDLQEERKEVMQALLELKCMPAGMELFPAANEDQWSLIKRVIDDSDYYIVIVAGRYGSVNAEGISYTEMEYRYALELKKPIIAFVHKDMAAIAAGRSEATPEGKAKHGEFIKLVKQKLVKSWATPSDLGSVVSRSLVNLINTTPAVGWVRADFEPDDTLREKIIQLQDRINELEDIKKAVTVKPKDTDNLAQGNDAVTFTIRVTCRAAQYQSRSFDVDATLTWDGIFAAVAPKMINEAAEKDIRAALADAFATAGWTDELVATMEKQNLAYVSASVSVDDFHTVIVQLRALGLMTQSHRQRSVKDTAIYWSLTPYGDAVMTRLRAIRK